MLFFIFSLFFVTVFQIISAGTQPAPSLEKFAFIKKIERSSKGKSYVCILSYKNKQYVLKQTKGAASRTIIKCVLEASGSHIAQSVDIPCHSTQIIEPSQPHHKLYKDRPATLHSFAKGEPIARSQQFKEVRIKQQCCNTQEDQRGLTIDIIKCMHINPIFPRLCAVDTFIGNKDRHRGNLFFDEKTQTFTAIDFNNSGKINLALIAQKNIEKLVSNKTKLEAKVIEGLKLYQETLKRLVQLYPPEKLIKNLEQYLMQATPKKIDKKSNALNIFYNSYKKFATQTYNSSQKLIIVIDKLLQNQKKNP